MSQQKMCLMELHLEISSFLSEMNIANDIEVIDGLGIIHAHIQGNSDVRSIIPIPIRDVTMPEARKSASRTASFIDSLTLSSGNRPLIICEDRWRNQGGMTKARLLAHLEIFTQIYARNCEVRKIDKNTAAEFLKANHSYGDATCRYRYGLYLKRHTGHNAGLTDVVPGSLVAVATFSNGRRWIKGDKAIRSYEWTRYASLPGVRLSGGMGRLLKTFIAEVNPDDVMTYADLEWSEGKVYESLGFTLEGIKDPVMFRIDISGWERMAFTSERETPETGFRYFQNLGSNKYRLKLTDYQ